MAQKVLTWPSSQGIVGGGGGNSHWRPGINVLPWVTGKIKKTLPWLQVKIREILPLERVKFEIFARVIC